MFPLRCGQVSLLSKPSLQLVSLGLREQHASFLLFPAAAAVQVRHRRRRRIVLHVNALLVILLFSFVVFFIVVVLANVVIRVVVTLTVVGWRTGQGKREEVGQMGVMMLQGCCTVVVKALVVLGVVVLSVPLFHLLLYFH
jgi:hypothetical protein